MTDINTSSNPTFTCPNCHFKLPKWKSLLLTRWTRYTCPSCRTLLEPVLREVELTGMFVGFVAGGGSALIAMIVGPYYGFWGVLTALMLYFLWNLYLVIILSLKYVHLKEVQK